VDAGDSLATAEGGGGGTGLRPTAGELVFGGGGTGRRIEGEGALELATAGCKWPSIFL
jgi:hypothetical protein